MPTFKLYIGDRGSGKTTHAIQKMAMFNHYYPKWPVLSNIDVDLPNVYYINDILKWMAVKTLFASSKDVSVKALGNLYCGVFMDEAAMQGLESRGSSSKKTVPNTYLIALSRKINIEFSLISQMMSMIDKRGQWLTDNDILCEAHHLPDETTPPGVPDHFDYTVYKNMRRINKYRLSGQMAYDYLFDKFDTNDVPLTQELIEDFIEYYDLYYEDEQSFKESIGQMKVKAKLGLPKEKDFFEYVSPKAFKIGERVHTPDDIYGIVRSRYFEAGEAAYVYTMRKD